jgi:glycosyltransferase involved in cell wall biosynthesis
LKNIDKVFIVIPAYNEEKTIPAVLEDLKTHGYADIIVIDDGSNDNTYSTARKNGARTASHPINLGQGSALQTGIEYALSLGAEAIVTFDADGQHMARDIKKLLKPLKEGTAEAVLGSRFLDKKSNIPWTKRLILKGGIILLFLMYGVKLTDTHNGFRAFSRSAAVKLKLESSGMEHASEIIEKIKIEKIPFVEIPVTIRYTDYSKEKGQKISNSFHILFKMLSKWFLR